MSAIERFRAAWIVIRDVALSVAALGGIAHQELVGPVHWELLVVYTAALGVPTALNGWALLQAARGSGGPIAAVLAGPPPDPQPPVSSSPDTGVLPSAPAQP